MAFRSQLLRFTACLTRSERLHWSRVRLPLVSAISYVSKPFHTSLAFHSSVFNVTKVRQFAKPSKETVLKNKNRVHFRVQTWLTKPFFDIPWQSTKITNPWISVIVYQMTNAETYIVCSKRITFNSLKTAEVQRFSVFLLSPTPLILSPNAPAICMI